MLVSKLSNYNLENKYSDEKSFPIAVDTDLTTIFTALQNRLRFGTGTSGQNGENISGQFVQYTSNATPNSEDTISHTIGSVPVGYLILWQDKAGSFYQGPTTGTDWTSSAIYLKCSVASVTTLLFLIK